VLGARREYEAAESAGRAAASGTGPSAAAAAAGAAARAAAAEAAGDDSIVSCNGLPVLVRSGDAQASDGGRSGGGGGSGVFQPSVTCAHTLEWRETPLEARLVDSLGLTSAAAKEAAAASASEAAGGVGVRAADQLWV
jgi:hypothetical protein